MILLFLSSRFLIVASSSSSLIVEFPFFCKGLFRSGKLNNHRNFDNRFKTQKIHKNIMIMGNKLCGIRNMMQNVLMVYLFVNLSLRDFDPSRSKVCRSLCKRSLGLLTGFLKRHCTLNGNLHKRITGNKVKI